LSWNHSEESRPGIELLDALVTRMGEVGLTLHPDKTRIAYCKDKTRRGIHEHTSFTFLGYQFRPRRAVDVNGGHSTSFIPAVSPGALKAMGVVLRKLRIHHRTGSTLDDLVRWLNPVVRGWMQYYGRFYRSALYPFLRRVNT
jgi:RNA-directed DNA polymerase